LELICTEISKCIYEMAHTTAITIKRKHLLLLEP
jgi:hypothetical protein